MAAYYPPAVSDFDLLKAARRARATGAGSGASVDVLDDALCEAIGCRAAVSGTSWVLMLALLLRHLNREREGSEVVLTGYSCNEFTKATLLAGLRPVYVELHDDLRTDPQRIEDALGADTLAAFAINNVGVESDNRAIAQSCRENGVTCIEDATYTYLGTSDRYDEPFGSFGDFAILNFSEGKIIPVGGGAVLLNSVEHRDIFEAVRREVHRCRPARATAELLALLVYKAGSSKLGYSLYRRLTERMDVDLKQRFSMEPTRPAEDQTGLRRDARGRVTMRDGQAEALSAKTPQPLGRVKQHCGVDVVENIHQYRRPRKQRYEQLREGVRGMEHVRALSLPEHGVPVRMPVLVEGVGEEQFACLNRFGVDCHYTEAYPMYGDPARPNANAFYEKLYTLPVHKNAAPAAVLRALDDLPRPQSTLQPHL